MNKHKIRWLPLLALAVLAAAPVDAFAQRDRDGRRGQDRARLEERIRAQMGRMIQERLGLDEEQSEALSAVVEDFEERRGELARAERATRRQVEALIREGAGDDAEARELILRMSELRVEEAQLFGAEQQALLEVLSPGQVLELQSIRQDIGRRIRALRNGRGGDGPRRRGGGR